MCNIPKIIHYCWFGGKPIPVAAQKCINSWKKYCPDYKIIEWNESNFDLKSNQYVYEAYQNHKWAFVSDYARLFALKNYGGVYMDTDTELIKNLDPLLTHNAFFGFENDKGIQAGIVGASKENSCISMLLKSYEDRHFVKEDGSFDLTTIVSLITRLTKESYNIEINNQTQTTPDDIVFYASDYFAPKNFETGKIKLTKNTYCIHHYDASWLSPSKKFKHFCTSKLKWIVGEEMVDKLKHFLKR